MRILGPLLCAAILACGVSSASAIIRILDDRGGDIDQYMRALAEIREAGQRVVIDGNCFSACTLALGLIPRDRICVTPRARFGFHAVWMRNMDGSPVSSSMGTYKVWKIYPVSVRRWINQNGGLSDQMIYLEGPSLIGIVAICDRLTQRRLLLGQSAGYSGTLVPQILQQFVSPPPRAYSIPSSKQ